MRWDSWNIIFVQGNNALDICIWGCIITMKNYSIMKTTLLPFQRIAHEPYHNWQYLTYDHVQCNTQLNMIIGHYKQSLNQFHITIWGWFFAKKVAICKTRMSMSLGGHVKHASVIRLCLIKQLHTIADATYNYTCLAKTYIFYTPFNFH